MITKNIFKKTIPIIAFLSQSCSPSPEPVNKLKEYTLKNKFLYENFRELMEKRIYLSSKDNLSPDERFSQAEIYADEIKKLIQENQNKD